MRHTHDNEAPGWPGDPAAPPDLLWTRAPVRRRAPLTREAIVSAAVSLADAEGLEAVSVRRLAAALQARPMSIYAFAAIERKEELLDLMIDYVAAEMLLPGELPGHWRDALRTIAVRLRAALVRHPWCIEVIGRRVLLGPNGMQFREQELTALAGLQAGPSLKMAVVIAVEAFTVGQAVLPIETSGSAGKGSRGQDDRIQADESYRQLLVATGGFPRLAEIGPAFQETSADHEQVFLLGLDWLLSGIAAAVDDSGSSAP